MLLLLVAPTDAAKVIALRLEPRIPRLYFFSERRRRGGGGGRGRKALDAFSRDREKSDFTSVEVNYRRFAIVLRIFNGALRLVVIRAVRIAHGVLAVREMRPPPCLENRRFVV